MTLEKTLTGERLTLKPITKNDCSEQYLAWLNDSAINQYLETRWHKQSIDSIKSFIQTQIEDDSTYLFTIREINNRHIGNIKLGPINPHHLYGEVSYFIGEKDCWGKGYATEAISLVCNYGFKDLYLYSIQAGVYSDNIASARALEKSGFIQYGVLKNHFNCQDRRQDHILYNKINPEVET